MASEQGLDLVEVSPHATPPVCKILDYGKFKYEQNKTKKTQTKKTQTLKEIRMQPKISDHDLKFKTKHIQEFLIAGHKVKVTIRFKGRELAHTELGEDILHMINDMISCNFTIDKAPSMEGRTMSMMLSPSKGASKTSKEKNKQKIQSSEKLQSSDKASEKPQSLDKVSEKSQSPEQTPDKSESQNSDTSTTETNISSSESPSVAPSDSQSVLPPQKD